MGKKYIALDANVEKILRWAFNEIANGVLAADQVRKEANKKGI